MTWILIYAVTCISMHYILHSCHRPSETPPMLCIKHAGLFLVNYMHTPPPLLKSCHIEIKYAQCAETCEKNDFPIYVNFIFSVMVDFLLKIIRKFTKCHIKWPNYLVLLRFCSQLIKIRFRRFKDKKKSSGKKKMRPFFLGQFFFAKNYLKRMQKKHQISSKSLTPAMSGCNK